MAAIEPFNQCALSPSLPSMMVKLVAHDLYKDVEVEGANRGDAAIVLNALTRHRWIKADQLANELAETPSNQLQCILQFLRSEKLVKMKKKLERGATGGKGKMQCYYCLDYAQVKDVAMNRIRAMVMENESTERDTVQQYICSSCERRYSALDALHIINSTGDSFHCEHCNGELHQGSQKIISGEMQDGSDNARKNSRDKLKQMQEKVKEKFTPLVEQLNFVKGLPLPELSLESWLINSGASANNDTAGLYYDVPMPSFQETNVEVAEPGAQEEIAELGVQYGEPMPTWIIRENMNLT